MAPLKFKSTADIKVSDKLIDQVLGQDAAVEVMKKSAKQRRHVLLIGEPGTGKSLLGVALAELLPKEKLLDTVSFPNPNDENAPLIRTVPAGQGRDLVARAKIQNMGLFKNQNIFLFILVIISMIAPWWARSHYKSDVMFAAFFLGGMLFLASFIIFLNVGRRMAPQQSASPKLIVDNFKKKQAPFFDATGAHAGALLGDVLHDPFQCFSGNNRLLFFNGNKEPLGENMESHINELFRQHKVERKEERNYEAIFLPKNNLFVQGEKHGSVSSVEVSSCNRHDYDGTMIKLTTSGKKELIVTPEHKIAVLMDGKITYIEAKDVKEGNQVVTKSEDIIIDEQDIINTYDARQQKQCKLYYQYLEIHSKNPTWGYKRIAKAMNQKIGKTRWWHAKKHIPVPIQTANWLREGGLLPLKIDHSKLPLIAKVVGATFGDGGIFENLNGIFLSSSEKEAVKQFGSDLEKIFNLIKNENSRIIEGGEYGHSWCYQNTNRNLIRFFLALGAPKGNKTNMKLKIPPWIKLKGSLENVFFGSFLGGELCSLSQHPDKCRLTGIEVGISSTPELETNRLAFLQELAQYLEKKNIKTNSIYKGKIKNSNNIIFRLQISTLFDNVLNFMTSIELHYCKYKTDRLYLALGKWAHWKKKKYYELLDNGHGAEAAMNKIKLKPESLYLLLNHFGQKEATA